MKLVLVSDTHNKHDQVYLPDGDVLVHAGDLTMSGRMTELKAAAYWLRQQPHKHKVVIAGNHDFALQHFMTEYPDKEREYTADIFYPTRYLRDSGTKIDGVEFWGSPWQPEFCNWAFNLPRGTPLKEKWDMIPVMTDVLVTHGPPFGVRDWVGHNSVGCGELRRAIDTLRPKLHVFGHIHHGYGVDSGRHTTFVNASVVNEAYNVVNGPIVVDL